MIPKVSFRLLGKAIPAFAAGWLMFQPQAPAQPSAGWTTFRGNSGTTVAYPSDVFSVRAGEDVPRGPVFATADGRARLHIFAVRNERNEAPGLFLKRVFPKSRSQLTYDRSARNFFAVSEHKEGRILWRRCNFPDDGMIHCVDIRYPQNERCAWDPIVTRTSLSLRPR
jgi:hypothetical protein